VPVDGRITDGIGPSCDAPGEGEGEDAIAPRSAPSGHCASSPGGAGLWLVVLLAGRRRRRMAA
jgi:hypothetical protein